MGFIAAPLSVPSGAGKGFDEGVSQGEGHVGHWQKGPSYYTENYREFKKCAGWIHISVLEIQKHRGRSTNQNAPEF